LPTPRDAAPSHHRLPDRQPTVQTYEARNHPLPAGTACNPVTDARDGNSIDSGRGASHASPRRRVTPPLFRGRALESRRETARRRAACAGADTCPLRLVAARTTISRSVLGQGSRRHVRPPLTPPAGSAPGLHAGPKPARSPLGGRPYPSTPGRHGGNSTRLRLPSTRSAKAWATRGRAIVASQ